MAGRKRLIAIPIVIGILLGFCIGCVIEDPNKPKLYLTTGLYGVAMGVILLIALVPAIPAFAFAASIALASWLALALPETNRIKSFIKQASK